MREIGLLQPPAAPAPWIAEKDFQQLITDLATVFGWSHYHTLDSRGSDPGFPDLVLVRPPQILFVEVKARMGFLTYDQRHWRDELTACRCDFRVWQPADWDEILATLTKEVAE